MGVAEILSWMIPPSVALAVAAWAKAWASSFEDESEKTNDGE